MQPKTLQHHDIETILDETDAYIIIHSLEGEIIDASESAALELGYSRDEIKQIFLANIKPKTLRLSDVCKVNKEDSAPVIFERRNGKRFPAQISTQVLRAHIDRIDTNIVKLEFTIVDVVDQKGGQALELNLQESTDFLQLLSQELASPMQRMQTLFSSLTETALNKEQQQLLRQLTQTGHELRRLTRLVSDTFKLGLNTLQLNPQPFNLIDFLDELLDAQLEKLKDHQLELCLSIEPDLPELVFGDLLRLRQLFDCLMHIGVTYSSNSQITLHTRSGADNAQDQIRFELSFAGNTMSPEEARRLSLLVSASLESSPIAGCHFDVDIAIVSKLLPMMNGKLNFNHPTPNYNSFTVTVSLPEVHNLDLEGNSHFLEEKKVLLLERDVSLLEHQLQYWGARVEKCSDATSAEQCLSDYSHGIDLVILNHSLQSASFDLPANVRAMLKNKQFAVITYAPDNAYPESNIELPAPYRLGQLGNELARLVGERLPYPYTHNNQRRLIKNSKVQHNILLVDDSLTCRNSVIALLKDTDYDVDIAYNGIDAVLACAEKPYRVILMDVQMPHMDGIEATTHIRKNSETNRQTPIIALTGDTSNNTRVALESVGIRHIVIKPVSKDNLIPMLTKVIAGDNEEDLSTSRIPPKNPHSSASDETEPLRRSHERSHTDNSVIVSDETLQRLINDTSITAGLEMIDLFLQETETSLADIATALKQRDMPRLAQEAHAIKSASSTFGCKSLNELAKRLEESASTREIAESRHLAQELPAIFSATQHYLNNFKEQANSQTGNTL